MAFDRPEPTFRHEMIADYKAGRAETPDILRQQMGLVRQVVETLHIPLVEMAGFEADDVIATLATQARDRGDDVIVVTGDRDTYQLVEDPHIKVLYNRAGRVRLRPLRRGRDRRAAPGCTPAQYPQYAALRGDPSDNLPGVPGVGEKTAAKLINTYGGLDGIFAHLDELTPKLRQNLAEHEAQVRQNAELTPLVRDVPLDVTLDDLQRGQVDAEELRQLFDFLEFHSLATASTRPSASGCADDTPEVGVLEAERRPPWSRPRRPSAQLRALAQVPEPLALAGAWEGGDDDRTPFTGLSLVIDRLRRPAPVAFLPVGLLGRRRGGWPPSTPWWAPAGARWRPTTPRR